MLSPAERRWLEDEARDTLGLTDLRSKILVAVLDVEAYSYRAIAAQLGTSPDLVRAALEMMAARDLVETRLVGRRRHPNAFESVPGGRLLALFKAFARPPETAP